VLSAVLPSVSTRHIFVRTVPSVSLPSANTRQIVPNIFTECSRTESG
jgi:hypothetical protein